MSRIIDQPENKGRVDDKPTRKKKKPVNGPFFPLKGNGRKKPGKSEGEKLKNRGKRRKILTAEEIQM